MISLSIISNSSSSPLIKIQAKHDLFFINAFDKSTISNPFDNETGKVSNWQK